MDHYSSSLAAASYDLFAGAGALAGDVDFYLDCAARYGGPVLEIGAGTGRILIPLAAAGHEAVGLDRSPTMLRLAADKLEASSLAGRVRLVEADMTAFRLESDFSLILITARSFQHLFTPEEQRRALATARRHLRPGGHLVLDLFDPSFEILFSGKPELPAPRTVWDPASGREVRRSVVSRTTDPLRQTVAEVLRFEVLEAGDRVLEQEDVSWTLRWSVKQEIAYLLELTGFEALACYSDFQRAPAAYAGEQLWVARAI